MDRIKVEGHTDLVRDKNTGAVININRSESDLARKRKHNWRLQQQEQQQLKSDVDQLKDDISDIKDLLTKLVEK
jgi:septal ring factor EnvC (AmiA/AmiB activator)